jgi:4-hydroxybenzoate polyprenyltransferase
MKKSWIFILGAVLGPLVVGFGKLLVFLIGIVAIAWIAMTINDVLDDERKGKEVGT